MDLSYLDAVVLGIVEGLTEFLPVSSTGHLTVTEKILGLPVDAKGVTAYTALIQIGAIAATVVYFAKDIGRMFMAWVNGLHSDEAREHPDYTLAWTVIIGSLPVVVAALLLKDAIEGPFRSLWVVAGALIVWSAVMWWSERRHLVLVEAGLERTESRLTVRDGLVIGLVQCFSLIPGVSRSGATIAAGLARGIDRVTATRLSFFMAIPALTGASIFETVSATAELGELGWGPIAIGIIVAYLVAYASIAWLLKFVAGHPITWFVGYRVALGLGIIVALAAGWMTAT